MRKVILNLAVTLDGFIEGPNGEVDWCSFDENEMGEESAFDKFLAGIDTIFYGRVSYNLWGEYQPAANASPAEKKLWATVHSKKKYVFSKTPVQSEKATYICDNIVERVNQVKNEPGKNIWLYGGAGIITHFINEKLADTFLLAVHPVLIGSGKHLFTNIASRIKLQLINVTTSPSGVALMQYSVMK